MSSANLRPREVWESGFRGPLLFEWLEGVLDAKAERREEAGAPCAESFVPGRWGSTLDMVMIVADKQEKEAPGDLRRQIHACRSNLDVAYAPSAPSFRLVRGR